MVYQFITRSKGVVIFAVSLIAFGAFNAFLMVLSMALVSLRNLPDIAAVAAPGTVSLPAFWLSSILNLLIFLSWVVCGIGALHLKDWARQALRVVMAVYLINLIVNICLNVFLAQEVMAEVPILFLIAGIVLSLSYYLGLVYFFSHPNVVRQFRFGVPPV
ncbi:MAG: hypothetical protein PHH75_05835 [Candidatus Omnitrophica bacterium]|nr:hypothetical protein [Candidatus Omnitrophota bacterium]